MLRLAILSTVVAAAPLAQDGTVGDALTASVDESSIAAEAVSAPINLSGKSVVCRVDSKPARCVVQGDKIYPDIFLPSFQRGNRDALEIDRREWPKSSRFGIVQVLEGGRALWLPTSRIESADASATEIRQLAKSGEAFNCWEHNCYVIFSLRSGEAQLFAQCSTIEIDGVRGPPKDCSPVLFEKNDKVWMKAVTEYRFFGVNENAPVSESISVRAARSLGIDEGVLIGAVDKALSKDPFVFEKRSIRGGYNSLLAVANPRPSKILSGGWYEWPTVSVNPSGLTVYVDCDLLVNKYNTSQVTDWHQPTQSQQTTYCNALFQQISKAIESVCSKLGAVTRKGTNSLECGATDPK